MQSKPQSLAEIFGVNDIRPPGRVALYDLRAESSVLSLLPRSATKARPSLCSRLGVCCDGFEAMIRAATAWIVEGFVIGLAFYACGEGLVEFGPLAAGTRLPPDVPVKGPRQAEPQDHQRFDGG